jgi:hypothetical protein
MITSRLRHCSPADTGGINIKLRNTVLTGVLVLVLAIAGGLVWLYSSLDSLAQAAIEKYGPEITQVSVHVSGVKLAPADGRGTIQGLRLGNPPGFKTDSSFKAGEISLKIDTASLTKDVIVINEVVIQSPEVTYESGSSGNNLEAIQKNIESYLGKLSAGRQDDAGPKKKLIIDNLHIRDGKVNVNTAFTVGKTVSSAIPNLHLRDIGRKSNGASAGEVARQVWGALVRSTGSVVSSLGSAIKEGAKGLVEGTRKLFK